MVSYSNVGEERIVLQRNRVYMATPENPEPVVRGSSAHAAPDGPYDVCVTEATGGSCDGDPQVLAPGDFKFSIFARIYADSTFSSLQGGRAGEWSHAVVRTTLRFTNSPESSSDLVLPGQVVFNQGRFTLHTLCAARE